MVTTKKENTMKVKIIATKRKPRKKGEQTKISLGINLINTVCDTKSCYK